VNQFFVGLLAVAMSEAVWAQGPNAAETISKANDAIPQTQQNPSMAGMQMGPVAKGPELPSPHQGSGTAWQPASVIGYQPM